MRIKDKIKRVRSAILAIGIRHPNNPNLINIRGSGFCISNDGTILTAAHIYNKLKPEERDRLIGMAMEKEENKIEKYAWHPLNFVKKDDKSDLALFRYQDHEQTLLQGLELGDSEAVEVGDEVYFIGFPYAGELINDGFGVTLIANKGMISNIKKDGIDPEHPRNWFFIDSISNPGNSGCPVIDVDSNKVTGVMTFSFRMKSRSVSNLDIREPMHIAGAKPINLAKSLLE